MNLIVFVKRHVYIITHLLSIISVEEMGDNGIRVWFALADGRIGIPTSYFMLIAMIVLASVGTANFVCVVAHALVNRITLEVAKYKARKKMV